MKNLSVKMKMLILVAFVFLGIAGICLFSVTWLIEMEKSEEAVLRESIEADYDENIRNQVDNAISMLDAVYAKYEAGNYTLEEAKKLGADLLRELRYGEAGYFWADTYEGENVVLLGSDTEGTNRMAAKDANGYEMVKDIIAVGRQAEGGFTDYVFPKEGETEASPKRSYSRAFEPFKWVIGTGNYIDYIDDTVNAITENTRVETRQTITILLVIGAFVIVVVLGICLYVAGSLNTGFKAILEFMGHISEGDFTHDLPKVLKNRKDDIGILSEGILGAKEFTENLIVRVKSESRVIQDAVESVKENVGVLNENIEGVSATTQELAASMEETAASSDTIRSMSQELEEAARNIAGRSQDGAQQAADIHDRASKARSAAKEQRARAREVQDDIRTSLMKALEDAKIVQEIEVLSSAIMEITNQTNLLALNASIEAARAGEAGRGFAVVAIEIGGLADQSKQAVAKIQGVTEEVTSAVANLSHDAERLLEFVGTDVVASYDAFEKMADAYNGDAEQVDLLVSDFSATSEELLASIDGVREAIDGIADATGEGAKGTSEIAGEASDVRGRAELVSGTVNDCSEAAERLHQEIAVFIVA